MAIKASLGSGALRVLCRPRRQVERCCQAQRFSTVLSDLGSNDVENSNAATYWYGWGLVTAAVVVVVTWTGYSLRWL